MINDDDGDEKDDDDELKPLLELVKRMTREKSRARPSVEEALQYPFIQGLSDMDAIEPIDRPLHPHAVQH